MSIPFFKVADDLNTSLLGGLAAGAAGGGLGYLASSKHEDETPEEFATRRNQNALMGGLGGAAAGTAGTLLYDNEKPSLLKSDLERGWHWLTKGMPGLALRTGIGTTGGGIVGRALQGTKDSATRIEEALGLLSSKADAKASGALKMQDFDQWAKFQKGKFPSLPTPGWSSNPLFDKGDAILEDIHAPIKAQLDAARARLGQFVSGGDYARLLRKNPSRAPIALNSFQDKVRSWQDQYSALTHPDEAARINQAGRGAVNVQLDSAEIAGLKNHGIDFASNQKLLSGASAEAAALNKQLAEASELASIYKERGPLHNFVAGFLPHWSNESRLIQKGIPHSAFGNMRTARAGTILGVATPLVADQLGDAFSWGKRPE